MKARHAPWSAAEIRKLRKLYPDTPSKAIARTLRRRIGPVRGMAGLLGLKKSAGFLAGPRSGRWRKGRAPLFGRAWRKLEVRGLVKRFADTPNAVLAAELGRTVPQLAAKARALGLQKTVKRARLSHRQERAIARAYTGTPENMKQLAKRHGLISPRSVRVIVRRVDGRKAKRTRRHFTADEDQMIRAFYPNMLTHVLAKKMKRKTFSVHVRAAALGIRKAAEYMQRQREEEALRLRTVGVAHRFKKGLIPPNKGKRMPGYAPGRMAQTQFKKGESRNRMPLFSERVVDGYLYVKVAEVPNVVHTVNWKPVHILSWERANGRPMPAGHCLWFRDGDKLNVELSNLELITRAENLARNGVHRYPQELKDVIRLQRKLNKAIQTRKQDEKQDRRSA